MMGKIITFGEIMLRLAPPHTTRFVQATTFNAVYGGGEANVAVSLANYGKDAAFVTKLPKHDIGQAAVNALRQYGVDTQHIVRGGDRVGIYFLERGASQRPSKVIYDRANAAIAEANLGEFDWDTIFNGCDWFHFTGITPAISENGAALALEACKKAKEKGITISCDLNYRKNLWTTDEANKVMSEIAPLIDVCIANEEDADKVFGIKASGSNVDHGELEHDAYKEVAAKLKERFGFTHVAITLRESHSADNNDWAAMFYDGKDYYFSKKYPIHIVDRVGGGDSFAGGLIYAMHEGYGPQEAIEFAVAASCLKHSIEGDFNHVSVAEVRALMGGDGSGRVQR
ncbi:MAG: sugar kinase [Defluviitaleaceae bacterium]|nr:sugar kinase [Defluviitaleaceae bacterium]